MKDLAGRKMVRYACMACMAMFMTVVFGCGPAYQAVKRGDELLEMQQYYSANKEYIKALGYEHDYKKAKEKLCLNAKKGYDQELAITENYERSANYESALSHYRDLSDYIDSTTSYNCLNFPTINTKQKIVEMQASASEQYYKEAEKLYHVEDLSNAIAKYKEALKHNDPYKDCKEKIAESYYKMAIKLENQKKFREAAENYIRSNEAVSSYKDASAKAAGLYYGLGEYYLSKKLCRNAYNDFCQVQRINPNYPGISEKVEIADNGAVTKIAFMRFDNPTGNNIAGASLSDLIFEDIKSRLSRKASRFLRTMDREEIDNVLNEQKLGITGVTDEFSSFKQLKGVQYLIFGKLTQVNSVHPGTKEERLKTSASEPYECTKYDKKGNAYTTTCWQNTELHFSKISDSISLTLAGSMKVIGVASGETIVTHNINSKVQDSIHYATRFNKDLSQLSNVSDTVKELASSRTDLTDEDTLLKQLVSSIAEEMSNKILAKIDATPPLNDPISLKK